MARPRILFLRLGAIGDVVRTLPALSLVRAQLPEAFLAWVVEPPSRPLVQGQPDLDEVIVFDRSEFSAHLASPGTFFGGLGRMADFARDLRTRDFTVSLDFQGTFKSGLMAFASGADERIGYGRASVRESNHLFNNRHVTLPAPPVHRVSRNLALLEGLGIDRDDRRADPHPPLFLPITAADRAAADRALSEAGAPLQGFVFLYPGSSRLQSYKRYPADRFGDVARRLIEAGHEVLVGAGPGEEQAAETMRTAAGPRLRVLPSTSLLEMAEVIRRARLFIGGDTGPMHIAAFSGTPVVALFGPTDPALNAPWGAGHVVLDALGTGRLSRAARRRDPSIFRTLTPERIAEAALARLEQDASGSLPPSRAGTPLVDPAEAGESRT